MSSCSLVFVLFHSVFVSFAGVCFFLLSVFVCLVLFLPFLGVLSFLFSFFLFYFFYISISILLFCFSVFFPLSFLLFLFLIFFFGVYCFFASSSGGNLFWFHFLVLCFCQFPFKLFDFILVFFCCLVILLLFDLFGSVFVSFVCV